MFENFLKNPFRSEVIRNSSILISGNVLGLGLSFLIMPLLSRLYSEADFGVFALMMSLTGILSILSTGKYEEAFVLTRDQREASVLFGFLFRLLAVIGLSLFLALLFFRDSCLSLLNMEALNAYWYMIPVFTVLLASFNILTNLANKVKQYKAIASSNFLLNLLNAFSKAGAYFVIPNAGGLFAGQVVGQLVACFSFYRLREYLKDGLFAGKRQIVAIARRYKDFPLYNMPRGFLNSFSVNLPFLVLTGIFGETLLGLFFMGFNVTFRPVLLISNSIYQVLYEKTARLKNEKMKISGIINLYWKRSLLYMIPCFLIAFAIGPWFFGFVFGAEWEASGTYFRYILPWMFGILITTPMGFLPLLFNRQRTAMVIEIFYFISRAIALFIGIRMDDFNLCILLFSAVGLLFMGITLFWYKRIIRQYEHRLV